MPSPLVHTVAIRAAKRVPVLKRLPILQLLILGELVLIAKSHYERLTPRERRRLVVLLREGKLRPSNLSERQRRELEELITKADASGFVTAAVRRFAPV
jgi:TRAP-type C4-dicarboxylate transport system substrate-binding protein